MNTTKTQFADLYKKNRLSLTGAEPSDSEIEENYGFYTALVDLSGREGMLVFDKGDCGMTWEFAPLPAKTLERS